MVGRGTTNNNYFNPGSADPGYTLPLQTVL